MAMAAQDCLLEALFRLTSICAWHLEEPEAVGSFLKRTSSWTKMVDVGIATGAKGEWAGGGWWCLEG